MHIFDLILECFTKYDAFCSHSFDYASLWRLRHIVAKRFEIMGKFYSFKALLKTAGGGDASPPAIVNAKGLLYAGSS